jgi:hypothetical protein
MQVMKDTAHLCCETLSTCCGNNHALAIDTTRLGHGNESGVYRRKTEADDGCIIGIVQMHDRGG